MRLEHVQWSGPKPPKETDARRTLEAEGFDVVCWSDPPGRAYAPHVHERDESLWSGARFQKRIRILVATFGALHHEPCVRALRRPLLLMQPHFVAEVLTEECGDLGRE